MLNEEDPYGVQAFKKSEQYVPGEFFNPFEMFEDRAAKNAAHKARMGKLTQMREQAIQIMKQRAAAAAAAAAAKAAASSGGGGGGGGNVPGYSGGAGMVLNGPWGHPDEPGFVQKYLTNITLPDGKKLLVHRNMAPAFSALFRDLWNSGYRWSSVGSYNNRNINGRTGPGSKKSLHAWGAAVDIDPHRNPFKGKGFTGQLPTNIGWGAERYGLYWGARFGDAMHFSPKNGPVPWH